MVGGFYRVAPNSGKTIRLAAPPAFTFERCVEAHGWFDLPPFRWDPSSGTLTRALDTGRASTVAVVIRAARNRHGVEIELAGRPPGRRTVAEVSRQVRRMLRLDEDLGAFYAEACRVSRPDLRWAGPAGAGRLLRAPTVFEDLVKLICTTNCSWSLTRSMVTKLTDTLGARGPHGLRAFPSPLAMAQAPPRFYRDVMRAGYRAAALSDLARATASGAIDPEAWDDPARPTEQIRSGILALRGAGPYVADNLLRLLGRYDGLGLDSWCRAKFARLHRRGRAATDRGIARFYAPFGRWRGLALWCDLTRDWFDGAATGAGAGSVSTEKFPPA